MLVRRHWIKFSVRETFFARWLFRGEQCKGQLFCRSLTSWAAHFKLLLSNVKTISITASTNPTNREFLDLPQHRRLSSATTQTRFASLCSLWNRRKLLTAFFAGWWWSWNFSHKPRWHLNRVWMAAISGREMSRSPRNVSIKVRKQRQTTNVKTSFKELAVWSIKLWATDHCHNH